MKIKTIFGAVGAVAALVLSSPALAAPFVASGKVCSAGTSTFISVNDVKSSGSSAADCYGTFEGNDPSESGGQINTGEGIYDFLSKVDWQTGDLDGGVDLGFSFDATAGTWSFTPPKVFEGSWLFVIKEASCWAAYRFGGGAHSGGTYSVTFSSQGQPGGGGPICTSDTANLSFSHISIYGKLGNGVPEPASLALLGLGLMGIGIARRRKALA